MCACENVCDIRANDAYACQCQDTLLGAIKIVVKIAFHVPHFSIIR